MPNFIYLASNSPRRRQLLEQIGVRYQLLLPDATTDEPEQSEAIEAVLPNELAIAYVQRVAALKLDAALIRLAHRGLPAAPLLCADTTVVCDARIYGKPKDASDAKRMLTELSGRTHQVLTAVVVQHGGQRSSVLSRSSVTFAPMSPAQIAAYVASGEPLDKAGGYAIQGAAAQYVLHLSGSYTGIMGLPLFETAQLLRTVGVLRP